MRVFHGNIITLENEEPQTGNGDGSDFRYLVEKDGKIAFIGDQLPRAYARIPDVVELGSGALLPAFGDGHIHFSNWALFNSTFDVREAASIEEVLSMVSDYAASAPGEKVIFGYGHSMHSVAEKRLVTRTELDRAVKDRPVYLVCYDGHSAVANSAAIGLMPTSVRNLNGFDMLSGQIFFEAFFKASALISGKLPVTSLLRSIKKGIDEITGYGIGLVHTVEGVGFPADLDIELMRIAGRGAGVNFRVYFQTMEVGKVLKRKLPRVGGCFATALDGCFGIKDAALLEPYSDNPESKGVLFYSDGKVTEFVKEANKNNLQVQLHCIGDAAAVQAVDAIEAALKEYPRLDHRHTLVHGCLIPDHLLERIAKLGIGITLQPGFLTSPLEPLHYLEEIIGDRAAEIYPFRKMAELGINISGGSDGPVTSPDPLIGIHAACNHPDPSQSLTVYEALRLYTRDVARTSFDENDKGTLKEGKDADLVILSEDPLQVPPADLLRLKVENTYLAGKEQPEGKSIARTLFDGILPRGRKI